MKHVLLTAIVAFSFIFLKAQTTQQEYNYITVGYKMDLQSGHPILSGYSLIKAQDQIKVPDEKNKNKWWGITVYYFKKGAVTKALLLQCNDYDNNLFFLCIPTENSSEEIWKQATRKLQGMGEVWHQTIMYALAFFSSSKLP